MSDATIQDFHNILRAMEHFPGLKQAPIIAKRMQRYMEEGRVVLEAHPFWNSPHFFNEMPDDLIKQLEKNSLVIVKGDANYRRLLGDVIYPQEYTFDQVTAYFPTNLVALRTTKSDPIVGIDKQTMQQLDKECPDWRVSGKHGVIQAKSFRELH